MKNHGLLLSKFGLALGLATGLAAGASHTATAGVPFPRASTPAPFDLGAASTLSGNQQITVSVALPLRDSAAAQALLEATYTPGSAQYRKFLTSQEFNAKFGPTDATVAQVTKRFQKAGLTVTRSSSTLLKVSGSMSAVEAAFSVSLHAYEVPAAAGVAGYRYRAPDSAPQVDSEIAASVQAVTEEAILRLARAARQLTGVRNLCLAGGVALNCVANGKVWDDKQFDGLWIQPASGDAGGALGAKFAGRGGPAPGPPGQLVRGRH